MKTKNPELQAFQSTIESAFGGKESSDTPQVLLAVENVVERLDQGKLRVATPGVDGAWTTHEWIKKAILLYFRIHKVVPSAAGEMTFFDKIPLKKWQGRDGVRVVPPAVARYGAYVEPGAILMPSYVNIGAYVGEGTMVDTWATVGSCAQIGKHVHLSGGVGIGGVLEPVQASPVIIEDHVFIGSRCIIVEGAVIEEGAVLGAGVVITSSTRIMDVSHPGAARELRGRVPRNSVVIPGVMEREFPAGKFGVPCALIIGRRTEKTDRKTSLTAVLRDYHVAV
ncbi:2,3,4,5-tetrahydropyridine-2,6-dicarboxylate N-succinyltransferase [Bdellovibrionota bacterium FG-1]